MTLPEADPWNADQMVAIRRIHTGPRTDRRWVWPDSHRIGPVWARFSWKASVCKWMKPVQVPLRAYVSICQRLFRSLTVHKPARRVHPGACFGGWVAIFMCRIISFLF